MITTDDKMVWVDATTNPIFTIMQYSQNSTCPNFETKMNLLMNDLVKELGLNDTHYIARAVVETMMRRNIVCKVRPVDRVPVNSLLYLIATTVVVEKGNIKRVLPKQDTIEVPTDLSANVHIEKTVHNAIQMLPVSYEYEIILLPRDNVVQGVSLYNYENFVSDYYISDENIVKKNEIINVPAQIMMRPDYKLQQSMPMCMNGVTKYLTGRDFLNMRLVCKATNNYAKVDRCEIIGSHVLDIVYRWIQDDYWDNKARMKLILSDEEYIEYKHNYYQMKMSLLVRRKYAMEDYMSNTISGYLRIPMFCDLHNNYNCERCNHGSNIVSLWPLFYRFRGFSPEVMTLIRDLFDNNILFVEDMEGLFDRRLLFCHESYVLYIIYDFLRANGRRMTRGMINVFIRYRKQLYYYYLVQKSSLSWLRSLCPPMWTDLLVRNFFQSRRKRQLNIDFSYNVRTYECDYPHMYQWSDNIRQYVAAESFDFYFKDHGYEDIDQHKEFLDAMTVFF